MSNIAEMDTMEIELPFLLDPLKLPHPFSSLVKIDFGARTDVGKVRKNNEDAYLICRMSRYWQKLDTSLKEADLPNRFEEMGYAMVVADGMGGMAAGEVASSMAIRVCVSLILNATKWALKLDNPETREQEIKQAMTRAEEYFKKIDHVLLEHAEKLPRLKGMGTTLTGAYTFAKDLFLIHVGDSRAYRFRNGELRLMTRDQTVAQELTDAGTVLSEASSRRLRHTLTSCLGGQEGQIKLEIHHHQLMDGDRLLICSDGLTEMLKDEEIAEVLRNIKHSNETCNALVDLALERGGVDNVTVIVAAYSIPEKN
jgi:PPM family protein phosphatase